MAATAGRGDPTTRTEGRGGRDSLYVVVMTAVGSDDEARDLSRSLVEDGLVACAQRLPIGSIYRWEGAVVEDRETLVLLKTHRDRSAELMTALEARHPYDVPEIIELPVTGGSPSYLGWIDDQTVPPS
jgi:periplasmic divalent cation tolerance protein